jgi:hypothetical protein
LRAAAPELIDIGAGKRPRPPEVDRFSESFSRAGEKQEMVADDDGGFIEARPLSDQLAGPCRVLVGDSFCYFPRFKHHKFP